HAQQWSAVRGGDAGGGPTRAGSGRLPGGMVATMSKQPDLASVDPLALRICDAAKALGISIESFERYVEAKIKIVPLGTMKLVAVAELERFLDEEAYRIGGDW